MADVQAQGRGYLPRSPKQSGADGVPWVLLDPRRDAPAPLPGSLGSGFLWFRLITS